MHIEFKYNNNTNHNEVICNSCGKAIISNLDSIIEKCKKEHPNDNDDIYIWATFDKIEVAWQIHTNDDKDCPQYKGE
jgi:Fe2+ or Zn2+ uptake regulation protein